MPYSRLNPLPDAARGNNKERKYRFLKTREALENSGLMGVTIKTANLVKNNEILEKKLAELKRDTQKLLKAIQQNPENKCWL